MGTTEAKVLSEKIQDYLNTYDNEDMRADAESVLLAFAEHHHPEFKQARIRKQALAKLNAYEIEALGLNTRAEDEL